MTEELKAVAPAAPEATSRMTADDWRRVERHAAPQSIEARLKAAVRARDAAQRLVDRWETLLALRRSQVDAGTWPPPVQRVTWGDLRPGDVLADDPDRDVLVELAEAGWTEDGWPGDPGRVTVWYQSPWSEGLCTRSAPAGQEITIRARGKEADGD